MSDDQKEQVVTMGAKFAPIGGWVIAVAGAVVLALILTLVYWAAFNVISGAQLKFGTSFAVVSHALMPGIVSSIIAIIVLSIKSYGDVSPETMAATNLAAYLPGDSANWLLSLGRSLDVVWIWMLLLLVIGFKAANPRKISGASAFGVIFGLWIICVIAKVAWAAMM